MKVSLFIFPEINYYSTTQDLLNTEVSITTQGYGAIQSPGFTSLQLGRAPGCCWKWFLSFLLPPPTELLSQTWEGTGMCSQGQLENGSSRSSCTSGGSPHWDGSVTQIRTLRQGHLKHSQAHGGSLGVLCSARSWTRCSFQLRIFYGSVISYTPNKWIKWSTFNSVVFEIISLLE